MDDKELLEKSAKATGYRIEVLKFDGEEVLILDGKEWNPLEDDGDAFRLAVSQVMAIHRLGHKVAVVCDGQFDEYIGDDPYAATRRAIVRSAAAMAEDEA